MRLVGRLSSAAIFSVALALLAGCASEINSQPAASPEASQAAPPDVSGLRGDEAEQILRDAGYLAEFESSDGSVWVPANWVVDSQDPAAGDTLAAGGTVILQVSRYEPEATVWKGPADGTWDDGDYALGQTIRGTKLLAGKLSSDYEITITAAPTFTTTDGGTTVTMTSPLQVKRIQDLGYDKTFPESEHIFFNSGNAPESERYNESWGTHTLITCDPAEIKVGQSMNCTVSFTTAPDVVVDSYWDVNGSVAAAWPGQHT